MKCVLVQFPGSSKQYYYKTNIELITGGVYDIVASGTTYTSPVTVVGYTKDSPFTINLKTITKAKLVTAPTRKKSGIKKTIINKKKKTVTILWVDDKATTVKYQEGDVFDEEKAIFACYMKRMFENRGYYNEYVRKAIENAEVIGE